MTDRKRWMDEATEVFKNAAEAWKAQFEGTRWEEFDRLADQDKRHALEQALGHFVSGSASYPWIKRPVNVPITLFEAMLALWASDGDFEEAALRLRVGTDRLRTAIAGIKSLRRYVPKRMDEGHPLVEIIPREMGLALEIRIEKLSRSDYQVNARKDGDTLVISVDRVPTKEQRERREAMLQKALAIAGGADG